MLLGSLDVILGDINQWLIWLYGICQCGLETFYECQGDSLLLKVTWSFPFHTRFQKRWVGANVLIFLNFKQNLSGNSSSPLFCVLHWKTLKLKTLTHFLFSERSKLNGLFRLMVVIFEMIFLNNDVGIQGYGIRFFKKILGKMTLQFFIGLFCLILYR